MRSLLRPFNKASIPSAALLMLALASVPAKAQLSASELIVRLDRLEGQVRQLTGQVEQLQFRNQQLEQQLRRTQEDTEFRFGELGGRGGGSATNPPARSRTGPPPANPPAALPPGQPSAPNRRSDVEELPPLDAQPAPAQQTARRSDAFDPDAAPGAPGAPRPLGGMPGGGRNPPPYVPPGSIVQEEMPPQGQSGRSGSSGPMDLGSLSERIARDPQYDAPGGGPSLQGPPPGIEPRAIQGPLPPPPPRNPNATGAAPAPQVAVTPPAAATPRDEFSAAYSHIERRDYNSAEPALREFLQKHPKDRMVSDANYWLGESLYQRQRYRDAAEAFLTVSTKYENSSKAPDALLRLGQSLAALKEREAACATLGELTRKYPRASASVKQGVEREQKRVGC